MKKIAPIISLVIVFFTVLAARGAITDGLVSYWPLDVDNGGTTPDLSFGNDMTINAGPTIVSGQFSNAFSFNAASLQYLSRAHGTSPLNDGLPIYLSPGAYSIALWVKAAPQVASKTLFCMGNSANNTPVVWLETDPTANGNKLGFFLRTTGNLTLLNHVKSATVVLDNNWHHIAWVDNKGSVKLYVDGVLDAATNLNYTVGFESSFALNLSTIAALSRNPPVNFLSGSIDDVAVWERALTQAEVQEIRTNGIPTAIPARATTMIQSPVGSTNAFGDRVYFRAAAIGTRPLTYQWLKDGVELTGETNSTLMFNSLTTVGSNSISVVASNLLGAITNTVPLVVLPDPAPNVASGLVSYWPFNVATNLPVTTPDLYSHNDMALTLMDSNNLVAGQFGNALTFDGATQLARRVGGAPIYNNTNYSISFWVNAGVAAANRTLLAETSITTTTPLINFATDVGGFLDNLNILIRTDSNIPVVNSRKSTRSVLNSTWHHIVWTDQNGTARLYVDGVLDETEFSYSRGPFGTMTLSTTAVGALVRTTTANYFSGTIDDVAQWNRRLTWTEIQEIRTNGIPLPVAAIPPAISVEPPDKTNAVFTGDTVAFSVQATGTSPLSYQWRSNNVSISLLSNPTAGTNILMLANVQTTAAAGYSVVITNAGGAITSRVAQLVVTPYTPQPTGVVLNLDWGLTGSPDLQAGFTEMNLGINGTNFNGVNVTVAPIGGATLGNFIERLRLPPDDRITNNPPQMTQAQLYNDLVAVNNGTDGTGMSVLIERLAPNTPHGLTIWSWSTLATEPRPSDWIETASGTPVTIKSNYVFVTVNRPTNNFDRTFGALLTSSPSGKLQLEGRKNGGSTGAISVFINALRLVAQPAIRITDARLVNGNIRLTIETQYPDQPISIEEKTNLGGAWSPASGGGITETHGPFVTAEFPASAERLFYRVVGQ